MFVFLNGSRYASVPVRTVTEVQAGGQLARIYSYSATAQQVCAFLTSETSVLHRSAFGSFRAAARLCEAKLLIAKLSTAKHCVRNDTPRFLLPLLDAPPVVRFVS